MPGAESERDRIIDAAYRCLQETEGAAVAVADILEAAGLGTRAFYRHFGSKDDLLLAMFRRDSERVIAELESAVTAAGSPAGALRGYASVMMRLVSDRRRMRRVLVMTSDEARRARGYAAELRRSQRAQEAIVALILERGRDDGSFPLVRDARADARSIRAALGQAFDEQVTGMAAVTADQAADEVADFALRAVGFAASRAEAAGNNSANSSIIDLFKSILHTDGRTDGVSLSAMEVTHDRRRPRQRAAGRPGSRGLVHDRARAAGDSVSRRCRGRRHPGRAARRGADPVAGGMAGAGAREAQRGPGPEQ